MDPQNQLSGLDPKLKEAYERVMGTTIPAQQPPPPSVPPPQSPQPPQPSSPPQQPEPPLIPPAQTPVVPTEPSPSPVQPTEPPPKPDTKQPSHIATGFVATSGAKEGKKGVGFKLSPPLLILIGVALLFLYIFFWIRVFNLSLF